MVIFEAIVKQGGIRVPTVFFYFMLLYSVYGNICMCRP